MKFLSATILIALLSFTACLYLPWWMIAVAGFIIAAALQLRPGTAFKAGFIAIFLLWGITSFVLSYRNEHLLAHKISMLIIKTDSPYLLILITALIGGIVAGLGALTGSFIWPAAKKY